MFFKIVLGFEVLAALLGTMYFYKYRNTSLKLWIILLYLAPLAEIVGTWYSNHITYNNHIVFNVYNIVTHLILLKMIFDLITHPKRKQVALWIIGLTVLVFGINCTYASIFTDFLTLYKGSQTALVIIALALYLIDILKSNEVLNFRDNLPYIVFSGYMIFNIVYLPIYFTYEYIVRMKIGNETIYPVLHTVQGGSVIIMNVLFIFGLIWTQTNHKGNLK